MEESEPLKFFPTKESQELRLGIALTLLNGYWEYFFILLVFFQVKYLGHIDKSICLNCENIRGKIKIRLGNQLYVHFKYTKYL